jgi:hypothetical protein
LNVVHDRELIHVIPCDTSSKHNMGQTTTATTSSTGIEKPIEASIDV